MRLEEYQQAIELAAARRFQRGTDFHRVMAVIVNHGNFVDYALDVEATANAGKFGKAFADQVAGHVEIERDRGCGCGVAHIVDARRMRQVEKAEIFALVGKAEFAGEPLQLDVADDEVGLARSAVSDDRALDLGDNGLNVRFIQAKDRGAVKRNPVDELKKRVLDIVER